MPMGKKVRVAIIGCGGMARYHIRQMLKQVDNTEIAVIFEPVEDHYNWQRTSLKRAGSPFPRMSRICTGCCIIIRSTPVCDLPACVFIMKKPRPAWKPGWTCCSKNRW